MNQKISSTQAFSKVISKDNNNWIVFNTGTTIENLISQNPEKSLKFFVDNKTEDATTMILSGRKDEILTFYPAANLPDPTYTAGPAQTGDLIFHLNAQTKTKCDAIVANIADQVSRTDMNDDGVINLLDWQTVAAALWTEGEDLPEDIDKSGRVDMDDLTILIAHLYEEVDFTFSDINLRSLEN